MGSTLSTANNTASTISNETLQKILDQQNQTGGELINTASNQTVSQLGSIITSSNNELKNTIGSSTSAITSELTNTITSQNEEIKNLLKDTGVSGLASDVQGLGTAVFTTAQNTQDAIKSQTGVITSGLNTLQSSIEEGTKNTTSLLTKTTDLITSSAQNTQNIVNASTGVITSGLNSVQSNIEETNNLLKNSSSYLSSGFNTLSTTASTTQNLLTSGLSQTNSLLTSGLNTKGCNISTCTPQHKSTYQPFFIKHSAFCSSRLGGLRKNDVVFVWQPCTRPAAKAS